MMLKSMRRSLRNIFGPGLLFIGIALVCLTFLMPLQAEKAAGAFRVFASVASDKISGRDYPMIRLGAKGDKVLLDRCDGSFVQMTSYETEGLQPVYAAHNICRGETILPLSEGDLVEVEGRGIYTVSDERHTKKSWSTTDDILGMTGDFLLQTCFYGRDTMKFVALSPQTVIDSDHP